MLNMMRSVRNVILRSAVLALAMVMLIAALPTEALAEYKMPYYIEVDITNQIVTVYNTADGSVARQMICSTGKGNATPTGIYTMPSKKSNSERREWFYFDDYDCWAKYASRIVDRILFHSVIYSSKHSSPTESSVQALGEKASHGCVRLRVEDAKWIADNCLAGTQVDIFENGGERDEVLRNLLLENSYTGEGGMTYAEFQGISEDTMGRGSSGEDVLNLQYRLGDLGYYEGTPNGKYDGKTAAAIQAVQADLDVEVNGGCTDQLYELLFSNDAPVSNGNITIVEGNSGAIVKKIQQELCDLGLYDGDIDGIYDIEVIEAAKRFQEYCGYTDNGTFTAEMQQALNYTLRQLEALFGEGNIPEVELIEEPYTMATVSAPAKIIIRKKTSTSSKELGKVSDGDSVMVLGTDGKWAKIYVSGTTGYMYTKYLKTYTEYNVILKYSDGETEYSIGHTMEEYAAGANRFATEFQSIGSVVQETIMTATVNTGSDNVMLNLRAEANGNAEVLMQIPNGTDVCVEEQGGVWTMVTYENITGFLMSEYLLFDDDTEDEASETVIPAKVSSSSGSSGNVYAEASEGSELLGSLKNGTELSAIDAVGDNWIKIRYEGKEGYMLKADLKKIG